MASSDTVEEQPRSKINSVFRKIIVKLLPLLRKILHSSCTQRNCILKKESSPDLLHILSECSLNYLEGNIPATKNQRHRLNKFKRQLKVLASKTAGPLHRKKVLQRGGSFLGALLAVAIPALVNLLRSE
jgi:hypothetical protein